MDRKILESLLTFGGVPIADKLVSILSYKVCKEIIFIYKMSIKSGSPDKSFFTQIVYHYILKFLFAQQFSKGIAEHLIGPDMGLALAKGICISLLTVFLFMPGLILITYQWMDKTAHRPFMPKFRKLGKVISKVMFPLCI